MLVRPAAAATGEEASGSGAGADGEQVGALISTLS
jgi:hypothetical protein